MHCYFLNVYIVNMLTLNDVTYCLAYEDKNFVFSLYCLRMLKAE